MSYPYPLQKLNGCYNTGDGPYLRDFRKKWFNYAIILSGKNNYNIFCLRTNY